MNHDNAVIAKTKEQALSYFTFVILRGTNLEVLFVFQIKNSSSYRIKMSWACKVQHGD